MSRGLPADHPDLVRWNARYAGAPAPSFVPHPLAVRALGLDLRDGSVADLAWTVVLAALVLAAGVGLRAALFAVSHDEEFARASGIPVRLLNMLIACIAALTVTVAMRVVGLLLVSALMIVPVAVAQLYARSFGRTMTIASGIGVAVSIVGLAITYWEDFPPGATIVVLAILVYGVASTLRPFLRRAQPTGDPHPDVTDDVLIADSAAD